MPITIKKDAWRIKDNNGNYRSATLFSTMLPNEAQQLIDDTRAEFTEMEDEADVVLNDLADAKQEILDLETQTVNSVNNAGSAQRSILTTEGTNQKNSIVSLANTKKQEITDEGTIQVRAVNAKGQEVLASIPQDFTDLTDLVDRTVNAGFIYGTVSGDVISFDDGAENVPIKSLIATLEPKLDGYTGMSGKRTGKNIFNTNALVSNGNGTTIIKDLESCSVTIQNSSGTRYCGANAWYGGIRALKPFPKGQYTVSFDASGTISTEWCVGIRKKDNSSFINAESVSFSSSGHYKFTFDSSLWNEEMYFSISRIGNQTSDVNVTISNIMMVPGATEASFVPHQSLDISVNWQSSLGTVYGCSVDIVTGELLLMYKLIDLGTIGYAKNTGTTIYFYSGSLASEIKPSTSASAIPDALCSDLTVSSVVDVLNAAHDGIAISHESASNPGRLMLCVDQYKNLTAAEFKTAMSGVKFCYPLKSPIPYQLTPQEVTTLLGNNTIWIDDGTVSVTYPIDTKTYIDRKIRETVEEMLGA